VTPERPSAGDAVDAGTPVAAGTPVDAGSPLSIDRLDVIAPGAFAAAVAPLFEGARHFLGRLAVARPFGSMDALFERAREIAHAMPRDERLELIDAHPRLGAPPASVSALSFVEQGYEPDGTERATETTTAEAEQARVAAELDRLNAAYEARFGFRYCVFVAGRSRAELLPEMTAALDADRDAEMARALDAVVDIARDRYATLTATAAEDPA
jgi:2-oxo-4-hydroxy-4-carboxy-5-ureidoimidazoline decarboxylase